MQPGAGGRRPLSARPLEPPMGTITKPEVFIVESLDFDDEREQRFEGRIVSQILALSGKRCEYYYIRTKRELREVLTRFSDSGYRYLHLSCHGDQGSMYTTLDRIPFSRLAPLLRPHLDNRRLFVSACSMTNDALARRIMPQSGCYSILGPDQDIRFSDAAILWASLYHVMFAADSTAMKRTVLKAKAQEVADMYGVRLNYIGRDGSAPGGYSLTAIARQRGQRPDNALQRTGRGQLERRR